MKKNILIMFLGVILLGCGEDVTIQESEALRQEAFASKEYQILQASYKEHNDYKAEIINLFEKKKMGKMTAKEFEAAKASYIEETTRRMLVVKKNTDALMAKYPALKVELSSKELIEKLISEVE